MSKKNLCCLLFMAIAVMVHAQSSFSYTPEKPQPGDLISFTYTPSGDIADATQPVEAVCYQAGRKGRKADDLVLERKDGKYTGSFTADTAQNFIYIGFSADNKFDNNSGDGYQVLLYENGKPRTGAYFNQASFYQYLGGQVGLEGDNEKALAAMEKEIELYPENKKLYLFSYVRLQAMANKEEAPKIFQREIEAQLKAGLTDESDYSNLESLYQLAKLPEQGKLIKSLKKEKFPDGSWVVADAVDKYRQEKDIDKKKELLAGLTEKAQNGGEKWAFIKNDLPYYQSLVADPYIAKKDWTGFKKAIQGSGLTDKPRLASLYNSLAWDMQEKGESLEIAEEFARLASSYAKENWKDASAKKPDSYSPKQWQANKEYTYAMYADTYAMVLYRLGQYKKGLEYARESALTIRKGKDADQNNTYSLLAEKVLPKKQYISQIEGFVKASKATDGMKEILKKAYIKDKKSEEGFDEYITTLQKESYLKMLDDLRKSMIDETAPSFALYNLEGKKTDIADLKGKVVVVDFWATWCGPCKASFPGMQKAMALYKDNPDVKFIFVNTWEKGDNKKKNAADFITDKKYGFDVWMDEEDKVVSDFKVEGIPTKFVIDKEGKIRFKAIGFDGSDDKLVQELTAMIEMAGNPGKKGF